VSAAAAGVYNSGTLTPGRRNLACLCPGDSDRFPGGTWIVAWTADVRVGPAQGGACPESRRDASEKGIKRVKANKVARRRSGSDEILPEYDFIRARPNKYAARYAKGSIVVTLDPDVAAVFRGAREANDALRALAGLIRRHRVRRSSRQSA